MWIGKFLRQKKKKEINLPNIIKFHRILFDFRIGGFNKKKSLQLDVTNWFNLNIYIYGTRIEISIISSKTSHESTMIERAVLNCYKRLHHVSQFKHAWLQLQLMSRKLKSKVKYHKQIVLLNWHDIYIYIIYICLNYLITNKGNYSYKINN